MHTGIFNVECITKFIVHCHEAFLSILLSGRCLSCNFQQSESVAKSAINRAVANRFVALGCVRHGAVARLASFQFPMVAKNLPH